MASLFRVFSTDLDLGSVAGGDVGDGPARFFPDGLLGAAEQVEQAWQRRAVQDHLEGAQPPHTLTYTHSAHSTR